MIRIYNWTNIDLYNNIEIEDDYVVISYDISERTIREFNKDINKNNNNGIEKYDIDFDYFKEDLEINYKYNIDKIKSQVELDIPRISMFNDGKNIKKLEDLINNNFEEHLLFLTQATLTLPLELLIENNMDTSICELNNFQDKRSLYFIDNSTILINKKLRSINIDDNGNDKTIQIFDITIFINLIQKMIQINIK